MSEYSKEIFGFLKKFSFYLFVLLLFWQGVKLYEYLKKPMHGNIFCSEQGGLRSGAAYTGVAYFWAIRKFPDASRFSIVPFMPHPDEPFEIPWQIEVEVNVRSEDPRKDQGYKIFTIDKCGNLWSIKDKE